MIWKWSENYRSDQVRSDQITFTKRDLIWSKITFRPNDLDLIWDHNISDLSILCSSQYYHFTNFISFRNWKIMQKKLYEISYLSKSNHSNLVNFSQYQNLWRQKSFYLSKRNNITLIWQNEGFVLCSILLLWW